jgi:hypothetical protein
LDTASKTLVLHYRRSAGVYNSSARRTGCVHPLFCPSTNPRRRCTRDPVPTSPPRAVHPSDGDGDSPGGRASRRAADLSRRRCGRGPAWDSRAPTASASTTPPAAWRSASTNYSRRRKLFAGELLLMDGHGAPLLVLRPQACDYFVIESSLHY